MNRSHPSGHPAGTARPAPTDPGDRVITGARLRASRDWATANAPHLRTFDCAGRVAAVIGCLIEDPTTGWFSTDDLRAALRDPDTVDLALDVLTDAGVGCGA